MAQPTVYPSGVEETLFGFQMQSAAVKISEITSAARLTARVSLTDPAALSVRIAQVTVYRIVEIKVPDDGFPGELPPGVEPEPGFTTVKELVVVHQADGSGPVDVKADQIVEIGLIAQATRANFNPRGGELLITSNAWDPITVPLTFLSGSKVTFDLTPAELTGQQGDGLVPRFSDLRSAGANVALSAGHDPAAQR